MAGGKSRMFRVTSTRPRTIAVARIIASGDLSRGRSRRRLAARSATSASTSSRLKPERKAIASRREASEPFERTSIQTILLIQARLPVDAARRISLRAGSNPASASITMFASKVKPLTYDQATWAPDSGPRSCRGKSAADGRLRRQKDREIPISRLRNRRPKGASRKRAPAVANPPNRRCRSDSAKRRNLRRASLLAHRRDMPGRPHARPTRAICLVGTRARQAIRYRPPVNRQEFESSISRYHIMISKHKVTPPLCASFARESAWPSRRCPSVRCARRPTRRPRHPR